MRSRLGHRARTAAAVMFFVAAVGVAVLRVGVLTHVGSLRLSAPYAMNDFYSATYYPVRAFLEGENPHDHVRLKALYPQVEDYPPYLPLNLVLHLPFGLLPPRAAAITYFSFSVLLTLLLAVAALRLAGIPSSLRRVTLVAALLLLSRPGHWTLISGQHAILLTLLTYLALLNARQSPIHSGLALGICMYKPTFGVPLAVLMLASGYARAVGVGALVTGAVNIPLFLLLADRAGGVGPFVQKLFAGYHTWQNVPGMDLGSSLNPYSFQRVDVTVLVSRFVGHSLPAGLSLTLAAAVLAAAGLGLFRLAKHQGRAAADLSIGLVSLGVLLAAYHMAYDLVLLTAPVAALVARGLPKLAQLGGRLGFLVLFAIPGLNWVVTESVLRAWAPARPVWLAVASVNSFCLVALFCGYLAVALAYTRLQTALAVASGTPVPAGASTPPHR